MPVYEYECGTCGEVFEKLKLISQCKKGDICPKCKSKAKKIFSVPARYKGQKGDWNK